jgi:hypothetical protein
MEPPATAVMMSASTSSASTQLGFEQSCDEALADLIERVNRHFVAGAPLLDELPSTISTYVTWVCRRDQSKGSNRGVVY